MATEPRREVRRGEPITADAWNDLQAEVRRLRQLLDAVLRARPGALGSVVIKVLSPGLDAAADDDTPAVGTGEIRIFDGTTLADSGIVVPLYNMATGSLGAIATGKQVVAAPLYNKPGFQFVIVDPCV